MTLRELLQLKAPVLIGGASSALDAKIVESCGFHGVWASSYCISAAKGRADQSLVCFSELLDVLTDMRLATKLPIVADCETGFGVPRELEGILHRLLLLGIDGLSLEDNRYPKTSSLYPVTCRQLEDPKTHAAKIKLASEIACSADRAPMVFARTEALVANRTVQEAHDRCSLYVDAGADAVIVHSCKSTTTELYEFARQWTSLVPLVAIPTTYSQVSNAVLAKHGYSMVIYANQMFRAGVRAMKSFGEKIIRKGSIATDDLDMATLTEIARFVQRGENSS